MECVVIFHNMCSTPTVINATEFTLNDCIQTRPESEMSPLQSFLAILLVRNKNKNFVSNDEKAFFPNRRNSGTITYKKNKCPYNPTYLTGSENVLQDMSACEDLTGKGEHPVLFWLDYTSRLAGCQRTRTRPKKSLNRQSRKD